MSSILFFRTLLVANGEIRGASHLFTPSVGGATLRSAYQAIMKVHLATVRQQRQQLQNLITCAQDNLCVNYFFLLNGRFSTAEELHYRIVSLSPFFFWSLWKSFNFYQLIYIYVYIYIGSTRSSSVQLLFAVTNGHINKFIARIIHQLSHWVLFHNIGLILTPSANTMWHNNTVFTGINSTLTFLCDIDPQLCFQPLLLTIGFLVVCFALVLSPCLVKGVFMLIWHMCKRITAIMYNLVCHNSVDTNVE